MIFFMFLVFVAHWTSWIYAFIILTKFREKSSHYSLNNFCPPCYPTSFGVSVIHFYVLLISSTTHWCFYHFFSVISEARKQGSCLVESKNESQGQRRLSKWIEFIKWGYRKNSQEWKPLDKGCPWRLFRDGLFIES